MSANYIYDPYIYEQIIPDSEWIILHLFNRSVNWQCFVNDNEVYPEYIPVDNNSFKLRFYERSELVNKTGKVVVS